MPTSAIQPRPAEGGSRAGAAWRRRGVVVAGGIIGTTGRVGVESLVAISGEWPLPTLTVNLLGSFLLGFVVVRLVRSGRGHHLLTVFLTAGVLGAFTTLGAFAGEEWLLAAEGRWWTATGYGVASVGGGLLAAYAGMRVALDGAHRSRPHPGEVA